MQALAVPVTIVADNAVEVLASLSQATAAGESAQLALDLAQLRQFDSSALSLLLQLARSRNGGERPLFLLNPPAKLQELAELYGVAELLFGAPALPAT